MAGRCSNSRLTADINEIIPYGDSTTTRKSARAPLRRFDYRHGIHLVQATTCRQ
jgi:hypothetical protein